MSQIEDDHHASVFIVVDCGEDERKVVLIRDLRKKDPLWKFPGGKRNQVNPLLKKRRGETLLETVLREVWEETGLKLKKRKHRLKLVHKQTITTRHGQYLKALFTATVYSIRKLNSLSHEYEEAAAFSIREFETMPGVHPLYRQLYFEYIKPVLGISH